MRAIWCTSVIALIALLSTSCADQENLVFETIQKDPMSQPTLSMAEAHERREIAGSPAGLFGSPKPTIIATSFEVSTEGETEAAVDELLEQAERGGWELEARSPGRFPQGSFAGTKTTDEGLRIHLTIRVVARNIVVELQ